MMEIQLVLDLTTSNGTCQNHSTGESQVHQAPGRVVGLPAEN